MLVLECHLPFAGRWFVAQGGDTPDVNHHMTARAQWYGVDFVKVGGPSQRAPAKSARAAVTDFYSWGEPVLSPVAGEINAVVDQFPDQPLGAKDPKNLLGNHVVISVAPDRHLFLAHLQHGSVTVTTGQQVAVGQQLGKCGNSGNSDCPHIHLHVQDTPTFNQGQGINMIFKGINVELTGQKFENVNWPLIRGLFVWRA